MLEKRATPRERGVWSALESRRPMTLNEIELVTGVEPPAILKYVELLMARGYVRFAGLRRADSGEAIPAFQLILRYGPLAPFMDECGELVDPNETFFLQAGMRHGERQERKGPRKPSLAARVRVAAEGLPYFTRAELLAAVFGPEPSHVKRQWFMATWNQMKLRGQVIAAEDGRFFLVPDVDPAVDSIRNILRRSDGKPISRQSITEELGFSPTGPQMRHALDLLKAEGIQVTRTNGRGKGDYVVQAASASAGMSDDEDRAGLRARMITGSTRRSRLQAVRQ